MNALPSALIDSNSPAPAAGQVSGPAFRARYLDSGFYVISDRAAGALVRANGRDLPRQGWQARVFLTIAGEAGEAELIRTPIRHTLAPRIASRNGRAWKWALFGFRRTAETFPGAGVRAEFPALGREFAFSPRSHA